MARRPCASGPRPGGQHRSIRGRARGAGSEFVLACDLRFASRENTLLGQFEVGIGVPPGGGPMARLPRLVGRGRALEILLVADDLDGPRAEQYGYVNRVIADDQLDDEVEAIASDSRASTTTRSRARSHTSTRSRCPPTASLGRPWTIFASCSGVPRSRRVGPARGARAQHRQRPRTVARPARASRRSRTPELRPGRARSRRREALGRALGGTGSRAWRTPCEGATPRCAG